MFKRTHFVAGAAMALCLALPANAEGHATAETVVATVNGEEITLGHMIVVRAGLPDQYKNLPDNVLFTGILDQLIQQAALAQGLGDRIPNRVAVALDNERRSLLAAEEIDRVIGETMTETAVQAAYDEKYEGQDPEKEFNASHILVETEEEAAALVTELDGGADFAELAKAKSTGPSGPNGGELGWFGTGMMVPEFEQAVVAMEAGTVSAPVQTQFGWHVIKLNETRAKDAPKLEEVREELQSEISQRTVEAFIEDVTSKATITRKTDAEIDPALTKDISLLEE